MNPSIDLKTILELHRKWIYGEDGGSRADLFGADLSGANLSGANLFGANLSRANLYGANLSGANLSGADVSRANLSRADVSRADLSRADVSRADLSRADVSRADLSRADLSGANLEDCKGSELALAMSTHLPEGPFHAWKKCQNGVLVKLLIPADAQRSHGCERKCRASKVKVLEVIGAEVGISIHDGVTEYRKGKTILPNGWDENRWNTCGQGIHFYLTRLEAEAHT